MNEVDRDVRPCPECGGERVPARVSQHFYLAPEHSMLMSMAGTPARAVVCTECGHVTLFAAEPLIFLPEQR